MNWVIGTYVLLECKVPKINNFEMSNHNLFACTIRSHLKCKFNYMYLETKVHG